MTLVRRPNLYVASSWRNERHPHLVGELQRQDAVELYNFREPARGGTGFAWSDIDLGWQGWNRHHFRDALDHPIARGGFRVDMAALQTSDACLLVLPSGRSAHLELGWAVGAGKRTAVYMPDDDFEPELMYRMVDSIFTTMGEVLDWTEGLGEVCREAR